MSADVVGYSRLMGDDEQATVATLIEYRAAIARVITRHNGRVVDAPGDNILADFPSAVEAVKCATEIQQVVRGRNLELPPERRMEFRIGVNLGDVIEETDGTIYGDGVNIAARLEALADEGGICVSSPVFDAIEGKLDLGFDFLGQQQVKNIAKPVSVYRVRIDAAENRAPTRMGAWRRNGALAAMLLALGLAGGALATWLSFGRASSETAVRTDPLQRAAPVAAAPGAYLLVGHLVDFTGISGSGGQDYGQATIDASNWINANGGINGKLIDLDTVQTSYLVPRALAGYRKWQTQHPYAITGWGTAVAEALVGFVTTDPVPYFSAAYSASLTDPTGRGGGRAAPFNFFYGPTYSDACRGLVEWARADWQTSGDARNPRYVHMGDNQPYPNAPRKACEEYARELGFEVMPAIVFSLVPGDFTPQCMRLQEIEADYAFLANLNDSVTQLLQSCHAVGVETQFMSNIWGYDETVMQRAGEAADGVVWVMTTARWGDEVPGMYTVREVSRMSDPDQRKYRSVHYVRGICSFFYLKEAMEWTDTNGGLSGPNIKRAMYQKEDWVPAGLEGVCSPATWRADDHRGVTRVLIYRGRVTGPTDAEMQELIDGGVIAMERVFTADIPRRREWLGR